MILRFMDWLARLLKWEPEIPPVSPQEPPHEEPEPEPIPGPKPLQKLVLAYEAQPWVVTQPWGTYDPDTYRRYGYDRHSGIDVRHGHNRRIRAPFDFQFYRILWQPNGGGKVLSILSKEEYEGPDGKAARVVVDYLHLDEILKTTGSGKKGELICIAGNTGVTYGPHCHISYTWVREVKGKLVEIEKNDADNTFDPIPFYDGTFAVDFKV